ncbi:MAG: UDP-N-acetylmuramate--L-alanine ligase [Actinobacteria bacterium]|nr:UDP-N-acetylmuramate--L-alanine ligase [Actinomycetota bacterium]
MIDRGFLNDDRSTSVHLVGVGGAGMSGLAKLLRQDGYTVSGSDLKPGRVLNRLRDLGVAAWTGSDPAKALTADILVKSSAVPPSDPEVRAFAQAGRPVLGRPELLERMTAAVPAIGCAGTHGKTTSTALMIHALRNSGHDPSFMVGGQLSDLHTNAHLGADETFLLEADEAFGTFRSLHLRGVLVTNIDADHLDYYGNVAALEEAFALVATRTEGPVVGCIDDGGVSRLAQRTALVSYGMREEATYRITDVSHGNWEVSFMLSGPHGATPVSIPKPGDHIARNAAGVLVLLHEMGFDVEQAAASLASFEGVRRRFETRANIAGVTVVDDYAHHPTEIAATVQAARRGSWRKVWAVFQPHRYTRTAELGHLFGPPLACADEVIVTDVFAASETPIPGVSGRLVSQAVEAAGGSVRFVERVSDAVTVLSDEVVEGDLVLLLGAGDISAAAEELARRLESRP